MSIKRISLTEEELFIIVNRLSLDVECFNNAIVECNILTDKEDTNNKKVSALYSKLLLIDSIENSIITEGLIDSLNWLTIECIVEVKTAFTNETPVFDHSERSDRLKAIKMIKTLAESNGFDLPLTKSF